MTELITFIKNYQDIDKQTEEAILDNFIEEKLEKGEFILEKGKICT